MSETIDKMLCVFENVQILQEPYAFTHLNRVTQTHIHGCYSLFQIVSDNHIFPSR